MLAHPVTVFDIAFASLVIAFVTAVALLMVRIVFNAICAIIYKIVIYSYAYVIIASDWMKGRRQHRNSDRMEAKA